MYIKGDDFAAAQSWLRTLLNVFLQQIMNQRGVGDGWRREGVGMVGRTSFLIPRVFFKWWCAQTSSLSREISPSISLLSICLSLWFSIPIESVCVCVCSAVWLKKTGKERWWASGPVNCGAAFMIGVIRSRLNEFSGRQSLNPSP